MYDDAGASAIAGIGAGMIIFYLALIAFMIVVQWKVFEKAGKPGWGCLIPIYNTILMMEIAGRPGWWFLLLFIPVVNVVISIMVIFDIAKAFDQGVGFGFGLLLLSPIFYAILAFGDAQYVGNN